MKKCPFCAEEIQDEAVVCKHCGRDLEQPSAPKKETPTPQTPAEAKQSQQAKGCLGCLAGAALLFVVFWIIGSCPGSPSGSKPTPPPAPTASQAHIICQSFVKARLKAPGTADFAMLDYSAQALPNRAFRVKSYVDSQNSFGAQIRTSYSCQVRHKAGNWADSNNWELENLLIGEGS